MTALWKDGAAERLEVQGLTRTEVAELIEAALGAPVDGLIGERLWQLSRGNILYLRELVRGGRQTGALAYAEGIWQWAGPVSAPPQLVELIQARIGGLPAAARVVGEMVAFGEPLEVGVLARAGVSAADVEAAERAGLVATEPAGPDIRVRLGHPLFGEVIRAQTPPLRNRTVHAMLLVEAVGSSDGPRSEDVLRIAVWHLEAGTLPEPGLLVAAAGRALSALDYRLAERLCRVAGEAGAGWSAERLLAQALSVAVWALVRGRVAETRGAMVTASGWMREAVGIVGGRARLRPEWRRGWWSSPVPFRVTWRRCSVLM